MKVAIKKYNHQKVERKWQKFWAANQSFKAVDNDNRPKFYALDMFAYPSGDGLHVGHPRGYTATDILARYHRMLGLNVMRPVGWDAFGLPAENYAIQVGQPPAKLTKANIARFSQQVKALGFAYDWDREISTADPNYYKWTQWIFKTLYDNGYAYQKEAYANWCPKDQTVLANEQVIDGRCYRCDTEVEQKKLKQWFFKITDFADELIGGLDKLDWPESTKMGQRNWNGRSEGASLKFQVACHPEPDSGSDGEMPKQVRHDDWKIEVFTTRADTLFGATYLVLAPEHDLVEKLTTPEQKAEVDKYIVATQKKSALDRKMAHEKTGVFTGSFAVNPATGKDIPIWIADYVLTDYGTGAIMAVPAHDERDFEFAKKFDLPIIPVILKSTMESRSFVMGVNESDLKKLSAKVVGKTSGGDFKIEIPFDQLDGYKQFIRGVIRPGFWNEFSTPAGFYFIFKHKDGRLEEMELTEETNDLIDRYGATFNDEQPGEISENVYSWLAEGADGFYRELLIHPNTGVLINSEEFNGQSSKEAAAKIAKKFGGELKVQYKLHDWLISRQRYWGAPIPIVYKQISGSAGQYTTVSVDEADLPVMLPTDVDFQPTGESPLALSKKFQAGVAKKYGRGARRELDTMDTFVCSSWYFLRYCDPHNTSEFASAASLKYWMPVNLYIGGSEHTNGHLLYARFIVKVLHKLGYLDFDEPFLKLRHQGLILGADGDKMSKSKGNVVNPDEVVEVFGADALRMYEMFMGPFDQSLPWSTAGIEGVRRFLNRLWSLKPMAKAPETDRAIHKLIKKVTEDIDQMKFNTIVSSSMEFVNRCFAKGITKPTLEKLVKLLAPIVPHLAEEIYDKLGYEQSIFKAAWPQFDPALLIEDLVKVAVQVNGRLRGVLSVSPTDSEDKIREAATALPALSAHLSGKQIVKSHYVPGRIINLIVE